MSLKRNVFSLLAFLASDFLAWTKYSIMNIQVEV